MSPLVHDLSHPDYDPPDCPAWAKETLPEWLRPFMGRNGLEACRDADPGALSMNVRGIDRYQANQFVVPRVETAEYLYGEYTPLTVDYRMGTLPAFEALSAEAVTPAMSDTEKAIALLTKAVPVVKHPSWPPCGGLVSGGRGLDDEALLASGQGYCNEQARVFIRLCQINGIPARIVHLFYSDKETGHTIAEFHADGRWAMADATYFCVFPDEDGALLSAADCHDGGEGQRLAGEAYIRRLQDILPLSDEELNLPPHRDVAAWREEFGRKTAADFSAQLWRFAVINYPLPTPT